MEEDNKKKDLEIKGYQQDIEKLKSQKNKILKELNQVKDSSKLKIEDLIPTKEH